jgi:hypothetical protein
MECKICKSEARYVKTLQLRQNHSAEYYQCDVCGFLFVANPTWLNEAYMDPINTTDTGYVLRNVYLSRKTLILFYFLFGHKGTFLDFAGGYGMLGRLMRDYGFNFLNTDKYTKNLFMKGFEYNKEHITALTCFECFEHFEEPSKELDEIFSITHNIFFSTVLYSGTTVPEDSWEYYGLDHGQHISFYSIKTLTYIAKKYNVYLYSNGSNLHLFTKRKIPLFLYKILLGLTKIQADIFIRKLLISKTVSDSLITNKN